MDNNNIKFDLSADVSKFKNALTEAAKIVDNLSDAISGLSNTKISLDVNVKNTDFNSVFERLNSEIYTSNRSAKKLADQFDELFSGKSFQKGFTATFNSLNKSIKDVSDTLSKVFGDKSTGQTKTFSESIKRAISKAVEDGMSSGVEKALAKQRNLKSQFESLVESATGDITSDKLKGVRAEIKLTKDTFENISNGISNAIVGGLKKTKEALGEDFVDWKAKDFADFIKNSGDNMSKSSRNWSNKEWARMLGKEAAQAYAEELKNKETKNSIEIVKGFNQQIQKMTNVMSNLPERLEKELEHSENVMKAKERRAVAQADIAERKKEDYLKHLDEKELKLENKPRCYYENISQSWKTARTAYSEDDKIAAAQRRYLSSISHIRTLNQQVKDSLETSLPTLNTLNSAQFERQAASLRLNNLLLSDQLGIDEFKKKVKDVKDEFSAWGSSINKVANIMMNLTQAMGQIQNIAHRITFSILNYARSATRQLANNIKSMLNSATDAYKSLETSMIGFSNFFGEKRADILYQQIKELAAVAPGLGTTDLAEYVRQIAPVSGGNDQLALHAAMGMLKTIQYGGANGSTEMEYVIKNIRDVLAKGTATQIDIRQFNRAMPILEQVLEDIGESQLIKNGKLTIDKSNVDTILTAFAKLDTDQNSKVAGIFETMNKTLSGQWEQFTEQFTTNLMTMLKNSGVYGGAQHILSKVNDGLYVQDALARLGRVITNFMDNINWFKVQRYAEYFSEAFGIIWDAIKEAYQNITGFAGGVDFHDILIDGAKALGEFIKSMSSFVKQIITIVNRLLDSGIVNLALKLAPAATAVLKFNQIFLNFTQQLTKALGSTAQLLSANIEARYKALAATSEGILKTIPSSVKQNSTGLKLGTDANGNYVLLGKDYEGFSGTGVIDVVDKSGKVISHNEYANYANASAEFSKSATEISKTVRGKISTGLIKAEKVMLKGVNGIIQSIQGLALTESIANTVEAMDMFGDSATFIAGIVRTAGYAMTGAIVGKTFGGIGGGVVGALVGLGLGIASLVKTIKEKENELKNTEISRTLDEAEQAMYDQTVAVLKEYGFDVNSETTVGKGALDQLAYYIKSTPVNNRSTEEAVKYYVNALKGLTVGYGLNDYADNVLDANMGGNQLDFTKYGKDKYVTALADMVRKYGLAEGQGWTHAWDADKNANTYLDENGVAVPAEEILRAAFPNGVTDKQAEALLKKANELEENTKKTTTDKFDTMIADNVKFKSALDNIDENVKKIVQKMGIDPTDRSIKPNSKNLTRLYGEEYGKAAENWASQGRGATLLQGGWFSDLGMGDAVDMNHLLMALNEDLTNAESEQEEGWLRGMLSELVRIANDQETQIPVNGTTRFTNNYELMHWLRWWREQYKQVFNKTLKYASGGSVPAYRAAGVDTVPAMLAPGEFVVKRSAVSKAGLGAMYALNRGDLGAAARALSNNVSNAWNRNSSSIYNNRNTYYNTNNINVVNRGASGRLNSYYSLANRLSF